MLNKKNGLLALDDELVSSHATDVELKTVSDCKSGKEGPVSDCISDSQIGTLFDMQLRTKGVSCEENCKKVVETIPQNTLTESKLCMTESDDDLQTTAIVSNDATYLTSTMP